MAISFLTITKSGNGTGTVTSDVGVAPIDCGLTCSDAQTNGSTVTLTADPDSGSRFVRWSGGVDSTSNPVSYVHSGTTDIDAEFAKINKKRATGVAIKFGVRDYIDVAFPKEVTPDPILNYQNEKYVNPILITSENALIYSRPLVPVVYSNLNSQNSNIYRYVKSISGHREIRGFGTVDTGTYK